MKNIIRNIGRVFMQHTAKYWHNDELYLKLLFYFMMGKHLDLQHPKTFNEKLQWLKLYNRRPEYTTMVDKYAVKDYVASKIGKEYIIPTLGVWDKPEQIEWDKLPNRFVLKTTHGGGDTGVVICKDKSTFNRKEAFVKLNRSLQSDIYIGLREYPYKNVQKRIIAEPLLQTDKVDFDLPDYKFFCFKGEPVYCQVIRDRRTKETIDFYDMEWRHQEFIGLLNPLECISFGIDPVPCPVHLDEMKNICRRLSANLPFLRVDLYIAKRENMEKEQVYFGELTFYPASGMGAFRPEKWNEKIGDLLTISTSLK